MLLKCYFVKTAKQQSVTHCIVAILGFLLMRANSPNASP